MPRPILPALAAAMALAAPAASQPAAPAAPAALLSVRDVMRHVVNPAAERFWKGGGTISTEAGVEDRTPTTDASWTEMADAAAALQEAGNLLMMNGRARDQDAWMKFARQLNAAGVQAVAAAQAKDGDKAFEAGSAVYDACFNCHARYIPRPKNSLWKQP